MLWMQFRESKIQCGFTSQWLSRRVPYPTNHKSGLTAYSTNSRKALRGIRFRFVAPLLFPEGFRTEMQHRRCNQPP